MGPFTTNGPAPDRGYAVVAVDGSDEGFSAVAFAAG
jgi:hypothetical protein